MIKVYSLLSMVYGFLSRKKIVVAAALILSCKLETVNCFAQDIHFSQTINTPLMLNPSYCGAFEGQMRLMNSYKNQWSSISNKPYKTFLFTAEKPFFSRKLCVGLIFFNDKAGDSNMSTSQAELVLSSHLKATEKDNVSVGMQFGYGQKKFDGKNLVWDNQWDGTSFNNQLLSNEPVTSSSFGYFDLSSGLSWHHTVSDINKFHFGFGVYHLNSPSFSFMYDNKEKLDIKLVTSGTWEVKQKKLSNTTYLVTTAWMKQGTANELDFSVIARQELGLNSIYTGNNVSSNLLWGLMCRWKDAISPYIGFEYKKGLSVGLSYDINYSRLHLASYARGGFEIHLAYRLVRQNIIVDTTAPSFQK